MTVAARVLAPLIAAGLLFIALAPRVAAAPKAGTNGLTLTVNPRWNVAASAGAWTPYNVTVRNGAPGVFNGDVVLVPNPTRNFPLAADSLPLYRTRVAVPGGTERTTQIYVVEAPSGHHAELRDDQGRVVASADSNFALPSGSAVAILSDLPQAEQKISATLKTLTSLDVGLSEFAHPQAFPTAVVALSGLNAVILDQFDSGALNQAQVQALKDFVGLGGALILTGGGSWRRTLTPLPAELQPLRPASTASASLTPLAELGGLASNSAVQVAVGDLASWAKVALASPEGSPLIVEGAYGAGRILALTFDPLAAPLDGQLDLAALSWSQAISRGLSGALGGSPLAGIGFGRFQPNPLGGSGPGTWSAFPGSIDQVVRSTPAASSPPLGLLAALLGGYGLVVTLLSYLVLRALGRRGLLWVTVPALAVAFTAGAYMVGFGTRSPDYQLTGVQVQRFGTDGMVETYGLGGVLAPRRGDVRLSGAADTLLSSTMPIFGPPNYGASQPVVTVGQRSDVLFTNVAVWDMRPVQTLTMSREFEPEPNMPVTAQLRLESGRIKGQVVNHTSRTVRDVQLLSASGAKAPLLATLSPGATAAVDAPLSPGASGAPAKAALIGPGVVFGAGTGPNQNPRQALFALAASAAVRREGDLALVGVTDPVDTVRVSGQGRIRSTRAVVVEPTGLQSADSLGTIASQARLVSDFTGDSGTSVDVYEIGLPQGLSGRVGLGLQVMGPTPGSYPVEVYSWESHTWQPVSLQAAAAPLTPGEMVGGVVRVRVREDRPGQLVVSATSLP